MTDHDPDVGDHEDVDVELSTRRKLEALARVARFQPLVAGSVVALAVFAAVLEGVGVAFVEPIVAVAQDGGGGGGGGGGSGGGQSRLLGWLLAGYGLVGLPVTLGTLVLGVSVVMVVRYTASFLVGWLRAAIETRYVRHLQEELFRHALAARVSHFDRTGSDEVLNAIVTQSEYAGQVVRYAIKAMERALLALMYFAIAVYLAPVLAIVAAAFLGATTFVFRSVLDPGYSLGDEVASAKQGLQSTAQAGTQGIRDVKLFGLSAELLARFRASLDDFERYRIGLLRNDSAISSFYQLTTALAVFALVYLALTVSAMGVAQLGVFLFAMFRLGPKLSGVNSYYYRVEGELPHLVRTQAFVDELRRAREPDGGPVDDRDDSERGEGPAVKARSSWRRGEGATAGAGGSSERGESATVRARGSSEGGEGIAVAEYGGSASDDGERVAVPSSIDRVAFRDVHFSYAEEEEPVLRGVSVAIERGEFVGIVGPSGAGKSTIASLLARLHEPDRGEITADGTPIDEYDPAAWRSQVAVVRQDPYVFDDTLYRNLTVADRDASRAAVERAAAIARVDEFAEALPEGYETVLGDQGVRLSGGQRQRVAIARALLADADVLVLDEATSELDASTERRVHEALRTDQDDAALIAIAHQFSTVTDADVIHVLDGGRIRESGPHGELLSNDGTYARLYELQAVGE